MLANNLGSAIRIDQYDKIGNVVGNYRIVLFILKACQASLYQLSLFGLHEANFDCIV